MCTIYGVLLPNQFFLQTLFCREISFGTIYALLRGEKISEQFCPWRKNDKYEVCPSHLTKLTKMSNYYHIFPGPAPAGQPNPQQQPAEQRIQ